MKDEQPCLQLESCENEFGIDYEDSDDWVQFKQLEPEISAKPS
jgi:hypothetical protein